MGLPGQSGMDDQSHDDSRLVELELRYMRLEALLDALNGEIAGFSQREGLLLARVKRLEQALSDVLISVDRPAVDKPPHY